MAGLVFLLSLCCFTAVVVARRPSLPNKYHVTGAIFLTRAGVAEPFEAWVDTDMRRSRIDYYDGKSRCTYHMS